MVSLLNPENSRSVSVRFHSLIGLVTSFLVVLAACEDPNAFRIDPILVASTVEVAAPLPGNEALPTALDVTGDGAGGVRGGRFPERPSDALEWDFLVRVRNGEIVLVPGRAIGLDSRAALTPPLIGETLESLREAPAQRTFVMDSAIVMRVGQVYAARSREAFGFVCPGPQFSKFEAVEVDPAAGRLRLMIVTNERCGDPRLVPAN
jgi:hypothetical protein